MSRKNKQQTSLGRALIKQRFGGVQGRRGGEISSYHTSDLDDGYEWGRLNLQSITEQSSFQEFLTTAELANAEFEAEKLNITFVNPLSNIGLLSKEERDAVEKSHLEHQDDLRIPRRPKWTAETTPEELDALEKEAFLVWRRGLALLQENKGLILTPYEKNLEFWRQLWRVVERSDVIVQIVDARNPLLFRCADLEVYAKEVSEHKLNVILINKADFLTDEQRQIWAEYFTSKSVRVAFYSATLVAEEDSVNNTENVEGTGQESSEQTVDESESVKSACGDSKIPSEDSSENCTQGTSANETTLNSSKLLSRKDLIEFLKGCHKGPRVSEKVVTVGLVGYPNVGKSSTINSLLAEKKVSVSATPGKTKHFQTLYLDSDLLLCDCPGLVMPSFVATRPEMVLNGILPIDQLRDYVEPINLLSSLIPRRVLEDTYGIMLPAPLEGEDPTRPPTSQELLNVFGYNRGFMTHKGIPDNARSARVVLKDFVQGKLLYCSAPPGVEQSTFHTFKLRRSEPKQMGLLITPQGQKIMRSNKVTTEDLDKGFFEKVNIGVRFKGRHLVKTGATSSNEVNPGDKSYKKLFSRAS